jgi:hypothetical protein
MCCLCTRHVGIVPNISFLERTPERRKTSTSKQARKKSVLLFPNPNDVPGTQNKFPWQTWIEDIDTHEGADYFTKLMWVETSYLSHKARDGGTVYNSDIEECVVEALMRMSRRQPYYNKTFYLKQGNWPYFLSSTRVSSPPTQFQPKDKSIQCFLFSTTLSGRWDCTIVTDIH